MAAPIDGYTIRLARRDESERLPEIERRSAQRRRGHEAELGLEPGSEPSLRSLDTLQRANRDGRLWVAADASGPVAFALVIELGLFAHLDALAVLPEHGERGLGGALLEQVCEWALTRGFSAVTLSTFRELPWNAPFYAHRGFVAVDAADQPPELARIVQMERRNGLRTELRVIMQREV